MPAGEAFTTTQRLEIQRAIDIAATQSGLRYSVFVGAAIFAAIGLTVLYFYVMFARPTERRHREALSKRCATLAMRTAFCVCQAMN